MTETAIFLLTNLLVGCVVMLYILHTDARIKRLERYIDYETQENIRLRLQLSTKRKRKPMESDESVNRLVESGLIVEPRHEETGIQ